MLHKGLYPSEFLPCSGGVTALLVEFTYTPYHGGLGIPVSDDTERSEERRVI